MKNEITWSIDIRIENRREEKLFGGKKLKEERRKPTWEIKPRMIHLVTRVKKEPKFPKTNSPSPSQTKPTEKALHDIFKIKINGDLITIIYQWANSFFFFNLIREEKYYINLLNVQAGACTSSQCLWSQKNQFKQSEKCLRDGARFMQSLDLHH